MAASSIAAKVYPIVNTEIIKRSSQLLKPYLGNEVKKVSDVAQAVIVLNQNPFGESVLVTNHFTSAGTPVAVTLYTVPAGKVFYLSYLQMAGNNASQGWGLTDGSGGAFVCDGVSPTAYQAGTFVYPNAARVYNSIIFPAALQAATTQYFYFIVGWLEDK